MPTDCRRPAQTSYRNVLGVKRRFRCTSTYEANSEVPNTALTGATYDIDGGQQFV
jgi:hypothetical protein